MITSSDAAELLGVSVETFRRRAKAQNIEPDALVTNPYDKCAAPMALWHRETIEERLREPASDPASPRKKDGEEDCEA
jgi:hypothetical protein